MMAFAITTTHRLLNQPSTKLWPAVRMPLELLGQHELHEMRVPLELDPEELGGLPLEPVRAGPHVAHGGASRVLRVAFDLQARVVVAARRVHVRDDLEAPALRREIDRGEEVDVVAVQVAVVTKERTHLVVALRRHGEHRVAVHLLGLDHVLAELGAEPRDDLSSSERALAGQADHSTSP